MTAIAVPAAGVPTPTVIDPTLDAMATRGQALPGVVLGAPPNQPPQVLANPSPGLPAVTPAGAPPPMLQRPPEQPPQTGTPQGPNYGDAIMNLYANQGLAAQRGYQEDAGRLDAAFKQEQEANKKAADIEAQTAKEQAPYIAREAELADIYQRNMADAHAEAQKAADAQVKRIQQMSDNLAHSDAATKGFWGSQSIAQRVGWAIALGLGALGQATSGGRVQSNGALEMFDRALGEDARAKERQLAAGHAQIGEERGVLADLRAASADKQQALQGNYIAGISKIQAQIKAITAQHADEQVQARGAQLDAQLEQKKQQAYAALHQQAQQSAFQSTQGLAHAMLAQQQLDFTRQQNEWNAHMKQLAAQKGVSYRPSVFGFRESQNDPDYHKLTDLTLQYDVAKAQAGQLADYFAPKDKAGNRIPRSAASHATPEDIAMLNHLNALLTLTNLDDFHRGAAVSDQEWDLIKGVTGGDLKWQLGTPGTVAKVLDHLIQYRHDIALKFARKTLQAGPDEDPLDPEWLKKSGFDWEKQQAERPRLKKEIGGGD